MRVFLLLIMLIWGSADKLWAEEAVFFETSKEGWFWYWQLRTPPEKLEPSPARLPPTLKEMQDQAQQFLDRAIEAPTDQNVEAYMAYQRLLTQRAERFARVWQRVLWQNPELDPTVDEPVATAGLSVAQAERIKKRDEVLSALAQTSGLLYFFSGNCPLCEVQSGILSAFAESYGFPIVAISLDGSANPVFSRVKVDRGAAEKLGVEKVPALFLARPPSEVIRVGTGLLSMEELAGRLYRLRGNHSGGSVDPFEEKNDEDQDGMAKHVSDYGAFVGSVGGADGPGRASAATR